MANTDATRVSWWNRVVSAAAGSLITSLAVTPLDVVKVRLQAQKPTALITAEADTVRCTQCKEFIYDNGLMEHNIPKRTWKCFTTAHKPVAEFEFKGTWDALMKISRNEGFATLYSGLPPTLVMAIPATVLYFSLYDELHARYANSIPQPLVPVVAGVSARGLTTFIVSPLELIRTQLQFSKQADTGMVSGMRAIVANEGFKSLWRGAVPTLARDVPFSGLYWFGYDQIKTRLLHPVLTTLRERYEYSLGTQTFAEAFLAGASSGAIAAALTTPFDVVKTRRQVFLLAGDETAAGGAKHLSMWAALKEIAAKEGVGGVMTGLSARLAKVAPSCAIMISTYELGKYVLARPA